MNIIIILAVDLLYAALTVVMTVMVVTVGVMHAFKLEGPRDALMEFIGGWPLIYYALYTVGLTAFHVGWWWGL